VPGFNTAALNSNLKIASSQKDDIVLILRIRWFGLEADRNAGECFQFNNTVGLFVEHGVDYRLGRND